MRGGQCLKVWTKNQQVASLSTAAVTTASEGMGIQSVAKDLGIVFGLNQHLDAAATKCPVNRRGLGKARQNRAMDEIQGVSVRGQWRGEAQE